MSEKPTLSEPVLHIKLIEYLLTQPFKQEKASNDTQQYRKTFFQHLR